MRNSLIIFLVVTAFIMVALAAPNPGPGGRFRHGGGFGHRGGAGKGGVGKGGAGGAGGAGAGNNGTTNGAGGAGAGNNGTTNGAGGAGGAGAGNNGTTTGAGGAGKGGAGAGNNTTAGNATATGAGGAGNKGNSTSTGAPPAATTAAAQSSGQGQADNNICKTSSKTPGTGVQNPNGQCSNTVQGEIPDTNHMVSTLIVDPPSGATIPANKAFNVTIANTGLNTGNFDLAASQYYIFPQKLDGNGNIFGHQHITIQQLQSTTAPPDPKTFAFFKGLNDPAVNGQLSVAVTNGANPGLPAGNYRVCSMTGTFSHQPVLMPVAQRGAQDDCIRIQAK